MVKNMKEFSVSVSETIWDILNECDISRPYEIAGWEIGFFDDKSDSIWDWGICVNRFGDDPYNRKIFLFKDYCKTLAEMLQKGQHIVEEMTDDILEYISDKEYNAQVEYITQKYYR